MSYVVAVSARDLRAGWTMVAGAASRDTDRPHLRAVRITLADLDRDYPALRLVATDGYELRWADVVAADRAASPAEPPPPFALPPDIGDALAKWRGYYPVEIAWPVDGGPASVAGQAAAPVAGFPEIERHHLIPTEAPTSPLVFPASEWIAGLRSAATAAADGHAVTMRTRAGATAALLRTADRTRRLAAAVRVPLDAPAPSDVTVRVDARRLARCSAAVAGSARYLWVAVGPPRRPLAVLPARSASVPDLARGAVVMPMLDGQR